MSGDDAQQHLPHEQRADDPEIFRGGAHRRRDDSLPQKVGGRHAALGQDVAAPDVELLGVIGDERASRGKQQDDRRKAPQQGARGGLLPTRGSCGQLLV
jgi:hypothetical protein